MARGRVVAAAAGVLLFLLLGARYVYRASDEAPPALLSPPFLSEPTLRAGVVAVDPVLARCTHNREPWACGWATPGRDRYLLWKKGETGQGLGSALSQLG